MRVAHAGFKRLIQRRCMERLGFAHRLSANDVPVARQQILVVADLDPTVIRILEVVQLLKTMRDLGHLCRRGASDSNSQHG